MLAMSEACQMATTINVQTTIYQSLTNFLLIHKFYRCKVNIYQIYCGLSPSFTPSWLNFSSLSSSSLFTSEPRRTEKRKMGNVTSVIFFSLVNTLSRGENPRIHSFAARFCDQCTIRQSLGLDIIIQNEMQVHFKVIQCLSSLKTFLGDKYKIHEKCDHILQM